METFKDELDDHIKGSMRDPDYAAHSYWMESEQYYGTMPRVRETAFKAGFKAGLEMARQIPQEGPTIHLPERGWVPWSRSYDGWCRAIRFSDGRVVRVSAQNVHYPVSDTLAGKFRRDR